VPDFVLDVLQHGPQRINNGAAKMLAASRPSSAESLRFDAQGGRALRK
jgi:hypothetical protein